VNDQALMKSIGALFTFSRSTVTSQQAPTTQVRSYGQGTGRMVTLACNLDLFGSRIFASWTAVTLSRLHRAPAWQVRTLSLFNRRHLLLLLSHISVYENWCRKPQNPYFWIIAGAPMFSNAAVSGLRKIDWHVSIRRLPILWRSHGYNISTVSFGIIEALVRDLEQLSGC